MTETLTESFCERCGTRYEFSAPTRLNPLRKTRGLIGGLKNYLTSQDALGDALDDAMRTEESALATAQLDAFHDAFNFCIDCRQYTCVSCWNDDAGRCRSCVPVPGTDDLAERLAASVAATRAAAEPVTTIPEAEMSEDDVSRHLESWPTSDLPDEAVAAANGQVPDEWATTPGAWTNAPAPPTYEPQEPVATVGGFVGADGFVYETKEQADQVAANMLAEAVAAQEAARVAAETVAIELEAADAAAQAAKRDDELAAEAGPGGPETTWAAAELDEETAVAEAPVPPMEAVEPQPEPVAAQSAPEPPGLRVVAWDEDATLELEPEPIVAESEPEPEPVAAEVEPAPPTPIAAISETILRFPTRTVEPEVAQPAAADESPEVAARRAQLDLLGLDGETQPDMPAVLPYRSRGAAVSSAEFAIRAAAGQRFWEASAREVAGAVGNVGVQNCGECGLSLSANARFCRRCGTRQAQPA